MRSFRFLLSRRWALFALAVSLLAAGTWWLGEWQFDRLGERREHNEVVRANEHADPVPVTDVLAVGRSVGAADEWRLVSASGTYDVAGTVIVRYQTRDRASGVDVVVPLVLDDGTALLVNRGWLGTDNRGAAPQDVPTPPSGEVEVEGWVRADGTGSSTAVTDQSTRSISSTVIAEALDRELLGGFVELKSEDPAPATSLAPVELPDLGEGPHFFYGLQWWFFGALGIFGFFYLMYDEWRGPRRRRTTSREDDPDEAEDTTRVSS